MSDNSVQRVFRSSDSAGLLTMRRFTIGATSAASDLTVLLLRIGIAAAVIYGASILYGVAAGYALPSAVLFRIPYADLLLRFETHLAEAMLVIAFAMAGIGWLANAGWADVSHLRDNERSCIRLLRRWGLLVFVFFVLLELTHASGWSGREVLNYGSSSSIGGLFPASDANGYFTSPIQEIMTGQWGASASRRPFAAGFRQLTMAVAGYSYSLTLVVQAVMIAIALLTAARSVMLWRGLWPATAFCAFIYILARPFIATVLTEPLGLIWALLSILFLVEALRLKSRHYAFLALATLCFAEIIRMGSMFTIPAFVLWVAIAFRSSLRDRAKLLGAGAAIVGAVIGTQTLCANLYGNATGGTGSNFAYVLCGLALGENWTACPEKFADEFNRLPTEHAQTAFLFTKAGQLLAQTTHPLFSRMAQNVEVFVTGIPGFFFFSFYQRHALLELTFVFVLIPGLLLAWRRRAHSEVWFWALTFASMIVSAAIIFADDGWRAMHATWPFVALFLSLGFSSPVSSKREGSPLLSPKSGAGLVVTLVAITMIVPAVGPVWPGAELRKIAQKLPAPASDSETVAGRSVAGFVVIPDNDVAPRPRNVAVMSATEFRKLAADLNLERDYGRFVDVAVAGSPFAFVTAARIDRPAEGWNFYIAPVGILTGNAPRAWVLHIGSRKFDEKGRNIFRLVDAVHPIM